MAKEYKAPKLINRLATWLSRIGVGRSVELTTTGRKSGRQRQVPVSPITIDGTEYIVAPYGSVSWVENARANPDVVIRKGLTSRRARLVEVTPEAAHVVAAYYDREAFPRQYMDIPDEPTEEDFEKVSGSFPVFRVEP